MAVHELGGFEGHIGVGHAVKSVPPNAEILIVIIRQAVQAGIGGHGLVKGGIEHRYLLGIGEDAFGVLYAFQIASIILPLTSEFLILVGKVWYKGSSSSSRVLLNRSPMSHSWL